jgi:excisionase family DNA binding protein
MHRDILSVPEAASLLGCSDAWVIKMIRSGVLEGFRLSGRAWAVSRKSVEKSIAEYEERDPTLPGRKRQGRTLSALARRSTLAHVQLTKQPVDGRVAYVSMEGAAKRLGCASPTVRRVAKRCGVGIVTERNRIVAIAEHELPLIATRIHETSGNPNWIAARGAGNKSRFKRAGQRKSD